MPTITQSITAFLVLTYPLISLGGQPDAQWREDFTRQAISQRPALEVKYADASRSAFRILAQQYRLMGELQRPHRLASEDGQVWLWMEMQDQDGLVYSTQFSDKASRINLYRRGPYFCEVHWLDLQLTSEDGRTAPLRGDLALFCYPEKILAEITWHGTGTFDACKLSIRGIAPAQFDCSSFTEGTRQSFTFALVGEQPALADEAFTLLEGKTPVRYDARRGCYVVGTVASGSFQKEFYETPNRYETATFSVANDAAPRKIYICHESVIGGGIVEGGAVLDQSGHPLPMVVQVSKNFAGEKEERFYNPRDTPFSETYFPLYLEPDEQATLTSLHLYQNWGRHMTKHWSSLGAWMDYFHSSTGVTETTCYVPFKFGGIGGVSIADFRAMSQETYWNGQPQHDNLAGHSFLSFHDGQNWQHAKYESTVYRSTGPNWYDIQLNYISTDGTIRVTADIWETPQVDELRSFFDVRYEVLEPLVIEDAQAHFRFLSVASAVQQLRFTRFAASGVDDLAIDFAQSPFPVKGHPLPTENAYLAVYGDQVRNRGSNAVVVRRFTGPRHIGPAVSLQAGPYANRSSIDRSEDTRLMLVPDVPRLELKAGDVFQISGFWLPYGARDDADTPRRETDVYGVNAPRVTTCTTGTVLSDLPAKIKAEQNRAEFQVKGGRDLIPIVVTGLTDWKSPRIWRMENDRWRLLSHARNGANDGYQVFCEEGSTFGTVFLVGADKGEQTLRVSVGDVVPEAPKIALHVKNASSAGATPHAVTLSDPKGDIQLDLSFPKTNPPASIATGGNLPWKSSEGGSLWFESREDGWIRGGRISPNQDDLDLEYWWQNHREAMEHQAPQFLLRLDGTPFEDPTSERTWVLARGQWQQAKAASVDSLPGPAAVAVVSTCGEKILAMAWPKAGRTVVGNQIGIALQPIRVPLNRRYHTRGKVYMIEGDLESLNDRIQKDIAAF